VRFTFKFTLSNFSSSSALCSADALLMWTDALGAAVPFSSHNFSFSALSSFLHLAAAPPPCSNSSHLRISPSMGWRDSLPSWRSIRKALTWRNFGRFLVSPLMAAFIFFLCGLYANSVLQIVADRQVVHCGEEQCPPLPDLGHELFPHLTFVSICDYWLYFVVGATFLRFSPIFISTAMSLVMLRRWFFLQGMLFWMRGISVALTRRQ
jgi:hypothetical protein